MTIKLGSNISSLQAQRRLGDATASASRIYEQLSSGQRIVRASDDAAGLAIAEDLNAKKRVYSRAILNANEGLSVLAIADSALSDLSGIVTRIRELSEQSANGSYSKDQRTALDAEAQALAKEYFRISRAASFNKTNLFDGSLSEGLRLQVGYGFEGSLHSRIGGDLGTGEVSLTTVFSTEATQSNDVTFGDLNGDGILDMVTAGSGGGVGVATVRIGDGSGSFGVATSIAMTGTQSITSIALGDVSGDGILDLVTHGLNGLVSRTDVHIGNGNGTFGGVVSYAGGSSTISSMVLGDINNDGILDLVSSSGSGILIRTGAGNGSFSSVSTIATGVNVRTLATGDLNNDGIMDIVAAGGGFSRGLGYALALIGTGSGSFSTGVSYSTSSENNYAIALGDLNGDGILDIVTSGQSSGVQGTSASLLGTGTGTFGTAVTYSISGTNAGDVKLGDLNGDGILDLIAASNSATDGFVSIKMGTGTGTFGVTTSYTADSALSNSVALQDINGDGVLDVITAGSTDGGSGSATTFLGLTRDGISPILPFSLKTKADSLQSMGMLDRALENLSQQRGVVGAFQSRINVAINTLHSSHGALSAAESSIRDVDIASASADLMRTQILQQAATAILGQANQLPSLALALLRNS